MKSIDMFQMNKVLSKHIWPLNEENGIFTFLLTISLLNFLQYELFCIVMVLL